jgi:hypothetical protein
MILHTGGILIPLALISPSYYILHVYLAFFGKSDRFIMSICQFFLKGKANARGKFPKLRHKNAVFSLSKINVVRQLPIDGIKITPVLYFHSKCFDNHSLLFLQNPKDIVPIPT